MATKDWKEKRNREGLYAWQKKGIILFINKNPFDNKWYAYKKGKVLYQNGKTKLQALSFAKNYMKKH